METLSKKIWLTIRRFDLNSEDNVPAESTTDVTVTDDGDLQTTILSALNLSKDGSVVLKLRNHRGSLLPINNRIAANSKTVPYMLEVFRVHQNCKPQRQAAEKPSNTAALKKTTQNLLQRIESLEETVPALSEKQLAKMDEEVENMEQKLQFLNSRIHQAESSKWEGMFRRNPLW